MPIHWEERLRLGIATIDEQHETIFAQFAVLTDAITEGYCDRNILKILDYLNEYAGIHFSEEESLMALYNYSGIEEQRRQHITFKENISQLYDMVKNDIQTKELAIRIDATLIRYTINHVRHLDGQFIEFVKDQRSAEEPRP